MTKSSINNSASVSLNNEREETGLQSFKLVTYFSFSSLGVILLFTLILSWVISNNARRVMLNQSEEYSLLLAENLNQQVFRRFVLPTVLRYGNIALSNAEQFETLDKIVKGNIQGMKINAVTIYDSSVNIISYSTIGEIVGKKDVGGIEYTKALEGNANSRLISSGNVFTILAANKPHCALKTFIPFRQVRENGEDDGVIMGVMEIDKDLTKEYANILRLQGTIIMISTLISTVLFIVLRNIVSRAEKIIEKRAIERLKLEEKLNQTERLAHLGTMVATVSHEIKSPLGIVRSTAEILGKRIQKIAPGNEQLAKIIVDETIRLNEIVVEFLDFAKPQKVKLKPANINQVINKVLLFITPQLNKQQIRLVTDLASDARECWIDEEQIYRALLNIVINSLQAIERDGELRIAVSNCGKSEIQIQIEDSGKGISEEHLGEIFKPFYTNKRKGTGLGLAITKNIIDSHQGRIHAQSREGKGSTFIIVLPANPDTHD